MEGRSEIRRLPGTDGLVLLLLPASVVSTTMASSSVQAAIDIGRPLRWVVLCALAAAAVRYGWPDRGRLPSWLLVLTGSIVGVALLSTSWSVGPKVTAERAASFAALAVAVLFLGCGAARSARRRRDLAVALLTGPVVVALAGLVVLAVDHSLAVQAAQANMPSRLRGFGQNPNTASMLFAVVAPIAAVLLRQAPSRRGKLTAAAALALLYGSILASGSRGAILGAGVGIAVGLAASIRDPRRLAAVAVVAVMVLVVALSIKLAGTRPSGSPVSAAGLPAADTGPAGSATATTRAAVAPAPGPPVGRWSIALAPTLPRVDVPVPFVDPANEIGTPGLYVYKPLLAYGSGRVFAWITAIRTGLQAPILGFGFGTESRVFQDRLFFFDGDYTENSFVGVFLQLGLVGVLLFAFPFVRLAVGVSRARRHGDLGLAAATLGMAGAGLVVAFFQSYLYSAGNVATLTLWCGVAIAAVCLNRAARPGVGRS